MQDIFSSSHQFKTYFNEGLVKLARDKSLGTFILAMANATFAEEIYLSTKEILAESFQQLASHYTNSFIAGKQVAEVEEDLLVFLKMLCVGFENLETTVFRNEGDWELQFNHVRGFRPARISSQVIDNVFLEYSPAAFNFNKPFLAKERLWEGEYLGKPLSLYYNKYPFAHYHTLLVPEREKQFPQFLQSAQHAMMWQVLESAGTHIEGIGAGYNSRGAFSSVNHLHFQLFIREQSLPVMEDKWQHNGGKEPYPVNCHVFTSLEESTEFLEHLHHANTAYNLLYTPGKCYCSPRKMQGHYTHADWTAGFSWYELAGGIMTASQDSFISLRKEEIGQEYRRIKLDRV